MKRIAILGLFLLPASALAQAGPPSSTFKDVTAKGSLRSGATYLTGDTSVVDLTAEHQGSWFASQPKLRFCSFAGCNPGDHLRTQNLAIVRTAQSAETAELALSLDTYANTGYKETWRPNTNYPTVTMQGAGSSYVDANGWQFKLRTPGTSASSGNGPTVANDQVPHGTIVSDGTASWEFLGYNISDFKAGFSNVMVKGPYGGSVWANAMNTVLFPGANTEGVNVTNEFDYGNFSGKDCGLQGSGGPGFCVNTWLFGETRNLSTAAIAIGAGTDAAMPGAYMSAIWIQQGKGNLVHKDIGEDIKIDSSGSVGISFGATDPANIKHKVATIQDYTTSGSFLKSFGTKTNNVWQEFSAAPVLLYAQGNYGLSILDLQAATGTNNALMMRNDQKVCWSSGNVCGFWSSADAKFILTGVGNSRIMSIDAGGNMRISGKLTQETSP